MSEAETARELAEQGYVKDESGQLIPDYDQTIKEFDDGDIVSGVVVKVDKDEILVDIGYKSEGAIPCHELSIRKNVDPSELVDLGESIEALVLEKEDKDGRLILSRKRAEYEKSWNRIRDFNQSGEIINGRVIEVVKGGLILDIGLRGFLPASLVDVRRVKDLGQFIGEDFECRVIEMDRARNNVVLSRRAVLDEARKQEREKILGSMEIGHIVGGKVSSIVDFGAFVDLGGIDGLVHISELSWTHVDHPSEVLSVGDDIKVKVLDIDHDRGRVSLGLRQCQEDPWKGQEGRLESGKIIEGKVTKTVSFGAFVEISPGVEGLVHISELSSEHVETSDEAVSVGQPVSVKVLEVDFDRRRVSLSIRQASEDSEEESSSEEPESPAAEVAEENDGDGKVEEPEDEPVLESGSGADVFDEDEEASKASSEELIAADSLEDAVEDIKQSQAVEGE